MNLGADDYLTKPFTWDELLTAVNSRLENKILVAKQAEQKLDNLRGNILHALPHELRTPLTGIIGSVELIVDFGETLDLETILSMGANILESGPAFISFDRKLSTICSAGNHSHQCGPIKFLFGKTT